MSVETLVLALASAVRPTQLAAVYALLGTPRPRRLLTAYILAGLTFSLVTGMVVVGLVDGAEIRHGRGTFDGIVEMLAGSAAIGFAAGLYSGRVQRRARREPAPEGSVISRRLRDPSAKVAATAGIATHVPGLFYLVALNAIVAEPHGLTRQLAAVIAFNAIWWSTPIASLVVIHPQPRRHAQRAGSAERLGAQEPAGDPHRDLRRRRRLSDRPGSRRAA